MYLLKHICIEFNSVITQLIVALVLATSAYLFSPGTTGTVSQLRFIPGAAINSNNGHVNTNSIHYAHIPNRAMKRLRIIKVEEVWC
ncbi:hypothetical protein A3860_03945 [Niastella vici]|uniref:Uncharacterized protein n=1 Tax=Niastella vici TaxID=1703345 RepID=A0A1V9FR70_9BACT|nr:hypothetical protein A3860_03945 [Niastella vici]